MSNKNPLKSKTINGILLAVLPTIIPGSAAFVPLIGTAIESMFGVPANQAISAEAQVICAAIGAIIAVYGRYKATGKLSFK